MSGKILHYVITHGGCPDGQASLYLLIKSQKYVILNMIHYHHNSNKKLKLKGKNLSIMFCDVMPKTEILESIDPSCKITIIDHHKINEDLSKYKNVGLFHSVTKCACQLMWGYLYDDKEYPLYIKYIADRDLWIRKLPSTDEINAVFYNKEYTTSIIGIDKLTKVPDSEINNTFPIIGSGILLKENIDAENSIKNVKIGKDTRGNKFATITKCDNYSKVGHLLLEKNTDIQYVIIHKYSLINKRLEFSLRSRDGFDVCDLFKNDFEMKGGGHPCACGFSCQPNELNDIIKFD